MYKSRAFAFTSAIILKKFSFFFFMFCFSEGGGGGGGDKHNSTPTLSPLIPQRMTKPM